MISGQVGKGGGVDAETFVDQHLLVRVRQVILAANTCVIGHFDVVADDREIVERMAV